MIPYWVAAYTTRIPVMNEAGLNWDVTTFPTFEDRPDLGREIDYHLFVVPETAENRLAALRAVEELVTEETQSYLTSELGRLTVLDDPDIRELYASEMGAYNGKNLDGIFEIDPAPAPEPTPYNSPVYAILREAQDRIALEGMDINTALRQAEEEANTTIEEIDASRD